MSKKRWLDTGYMKANPEKIDQESGVVTKVKVCSEGEAKGHGYSLDVEFIETVAALGNGAKRGLKARFGHPNMCSESLGTYIGRFKNFTTGKTVREDGSEVACCFADLHLSETARETPNGDLYTYVLGMAENEEDMFGTSIVFIQGRSYRKNSQGEKVFPYDESGNRNEEFRKADGPDYIECAKLMACDCVDEPAANDGFFSAFSGETVAGQITEFLDLNPQVFEALTKSPEVMDAIVQYGEKFDEFLERYQKHREAEVAQDNDNGQDPKEAEMPKPEEELKKKETAEDPEASREAAAKTDSADQPTEELSVEEQIGAALKADRERAAEIRELGSKFGFSAAAEKFALEGRSVDEFRKHILNKSPEDWRDSLAIKNPSEQKTEGEIDEFAEGDQVVVNIKEGRKKRFGQS